jgi:hypothetical protein
VYAEIKALAATAGECRRPGCREPHADDSDFCGPHRDAHRSYSRAAMRKLRRKRRRARRCLDCDVKLRAAKRDESGAVTASGERTWCKACRKKRGRSSRAGVVTGVEKSERIAAAIRVDPTGRTRYHGQQKRGNQPHHQLDAQDQDAALRHIDAGFERLAAWRTPEVQALPRIQRESVRVQALHEIDLGTRFLDDVLERNGHFKTRHGKRDGE